MVKLYIAVGKYEIKEGWSGMQQPFVTVNQKEMALSPEEMILWSCLLWNIFTREELQEAYCKKAATADFDVERFDQVLQRMEVRGLVVSAVADRGDDALYKLLANLYLVPLQSSFLQKIIAFARLVLKDHVPISTAKIVLEKDKYTDMEQKVLHLAKQTMLSSAEVVKCVGREVTDVSTSEKVMDALYDDDVSTCDNLGYFMKFFHNHQKTVEAIATLYLNRNLVFDKLL